MRADRIFAYMYAIEMAMFRRGKAPFLVAVQLYWPHFYALKFFDKFWHVSMFLFVPTFLIMLCYQTLETFKYALIVHLPCIAVIVSLVGVINGTIGFVKFLSQEKKQKSK